MEPMRCETIPWDERRNMDYGSLQMKFLDVNTELVNADNAVAELYGMTGTGYWDHYSRIEQVFDHVSILNDYIYDISAEIGDLDAVLSDVFGSGEGPAEELSRITYTDIYTDMDPDGPMPERSVAFSDFLQGIPGAMPGGKFFDRMLEEDYTAWADAHPDLDDGLGSYLGTLLTMGEFDHAVHDSLGSFISGLLDYTGIWPIIKAVMGYDPITGDHLSTAQAAVGAIMGVVNLACLATGGVAGFAAGGLKGAALAALKELAVNALSDLSARITTEMASALGLPSWMVTLISIGVGITVSMVGTQFILHMTHADGTITDIPLGKAEATDGVGGAYPPKTGETTPELSPKAGVDDIDPPKPPKTPETEVPTNPKADLPEAPKTEVPTVKEAEVPKAPKVDAPEAPKADVPTVKDAGVADIPKVDAPKDAGVTPKVSPADVDSVSSGRTYQMMEAPDHVTQYAPEQLPASRITDEFLDSHGVTRKELIDMVNTPVAKLTPSEVATLKRIRDSIPAPDSDTVFQKVLGQPYFDKDGNLYFGIADDYILGGRIKVDGGPGPTVAGGPDAVGHADGLFDQSEVKGFVSVADDTSHLGTPAALHDGVRLDYPGTTFMPDDSSVFVLRFKAKDPDAATIPYSSEMGGKATGSPPFTGNGFTQASDDIIPEYTFSDPVAIKEGAEIWEITDTGTERLTAVFDGTTWIPVMG